VSNVRIEDGEGIMLERRAVPASLGKTAPGKKEGAGSIFLRRFLAIHDLLLDWYGIILLLVLWQLCPTLGWIDGRFFPPPSTILAEGVKLVLKGELPAHVLVSLQRTLLGLAAATAVGIPLGFVLGGWFPRAARFLDPLLNLLGQINAFSLFPLFVLFFGIGEIAKFCIIFWSCLWPILFTTISGVQGVDPTYVKLARSMGSNGATIFARVLFPGALPSIFTGLRLGATFAFLMLIAAEMIGASTGLGWLVHNSSVNYLIPRLFLAAVTIALLGMTLNHTLVLLERKLVRWRVRNETA